METNNHIQDIKKKVPPNASTVILVKSEQEAEEYYTKVLGFDGGGIGHVTRDDLYIILSEAKDPTDVRPISSLEFGPCWDFFCGVDDVAVVCDEFIRNRAVFETELHTTEFGQLEFTIKDIDGYRIAFGEKSNK